MKATTLLIAFCATFAIGVIIPKSPQALMANTWTVGDNIQNMADNTHTGVKQVADFVVSPPADDPAFDFSNLLRVPDLDVTFDASVSQDIIHSEHVTKIGYGHKSKVNVLTTASGTYSTDGLASPHVRYPGVETSSANGRDAGAFIWASRFGWVGLPVNGKGSFVTFGHIKGGGAYVTGDKGSCFVGKGFAGCS